MSKPATETVTEPTMEKAQNGRSEQNAPSAQVTAQATGQALANVKAVARPRLGFLGVGWIGRHRLEAVAKSGIAEIAAIADAVPDALAQAQALTQELAQALAQAQEAAPGVNLATSLDELLEIGVDGIVIATPSALHVEQAITALDRGVAVFCQKPLGRTAAETRRAIDAARAANRLLAVDLSYRFITGMKRIRELIRDGELGHIYAANLIFHNAYGPDKAWFYNPALSGGGCVIDLGIHLVDLALWTLDFPEVTGVASRLFAAGRPLTPGQRSEIVEDYAMAQLDLASGTAVQLACSWKLPAGCDAIIEASFYGTGGGASLRNTNGSFYNFTAERFYGTAREMLNPPLNAPLNAPLEEEWEWGGGAIVEWAERLAAGSGFDPAVERLGETAAALDRIYA